MNLTQYYEKNIDVLNAFCNKYNIPEDYVSDTYFKIKRTLQSSGLTEADYFRFIRRAIWNRFLDEKRSSRAKLTINTIDDHNVSIQAENALREMDDWDKEGKIYAWEMEYLTRFLFKYIETVGHYSEIEVFIFKTYAISGFTYKEIEEKFGLNQDRCKNTMRKFRADLRENFINYVEDESFKPRRDNSDNGPSQEPKLAERIHADLETSRG